MNYDELVADLAEETDAFQAALKIVDRALTQIGAQEEGALISTFESGGEFSLEERQKYAFALDQRLSEMSIEGWTRLRARLNNAEAHIIRQLLVDNGVGTKLRGAHQTAADVLRPSSRAEIWIRPWDVSKAQALMPEIDESEKLVTCSACGETSPSHFVACWKCGHSFLPRPEPVVD